MLFVFFESFQYRLGTLLSFRICITSIIDEYYFTSLIVNKCSEMKSMVL